MSSMERVLYNVHHRVCTFFLRKTSSRGRTLVEHVVLGLAVCGFGALLLAHASFVYRVGDQESSFCTPGGVAPNESSQLNPYSCLSSIPGFDATVDVIHLGLLPSLRRSGDECMRPMIARSSVYSMRQLHDTSSSTYLLPNDGSCPDANDSLPCEAVLDPTDISILYSFSLVKGYLLLSPDICLQHHISSHYVLVTRDHVACFGEPFLQQLIRMLGATDTVMMNWFLATFGPRGYVYNHRTDHVHALAQFSTSSPHSCSPGPSTVSTPEKTWTSWCMKLWDDIMWSFLGSKLTVVLKTCFLYFITTTLVSFTLRETQERMLNFTHQLQAHVRSRQPVIQIVVLHIVENLVFVPIMVGMIFFLIEFYRGDKFLSFMILTIVWLCEVFSVVR
jgi:hypothetical protein